MRPHVIPRVILKEFQIGPKNDSPVLVMNKSTNEIRARGVNHNTFLSAANYLGNGEPGTLENELACKDEASIRTVMELTRRNHDMSEYLPLLKFLLGNNAARNPLFRTHPKVSERNIGSSEEFHAAAMDCFPEHYIEYPIAVVRISSPDLSLILPDFSLTHMVLSPDIVIMRIKNEEQVPAILNMAAEQEPHFVSCLNAKSFQHSQSWVVANSVKLLRGPMGSEGQWGQDLTI